ncbi:hypothetical protein BT96DRAFT_937534 [Gymnopus androsaceus JB14]|uniref:Zn(2)-C6 fungal-type domain-containing protein n=1 Tax=Gymnopus androsaceus JB14 TaxID=1447944 RepID=A0A6A4HS21_9AGAR|nr:hypothetical protein BT96DRAFT_937534 [Gymnopus androsaceus JB14]
MSLCDHYQRPQNELKDASGAKITVVANLTLEERKEFLQKLFRSPTTSLIEPGWAEFVNASGGCRACKKKGRRCETSNGTQVICEACRRDKKKCTFGSFIRFRYAASQLGITLTQALEIFEKELPDINGKKGYYGRSFVHAVCRA